MTRKQKRASLKRKLGGGAKLKGKSIAQLEAMLLRAGGWDGIYMTATAVKKSRKAARRAAPKRKKYTKKWGIWTRHVDPAGFDLYTLKKGGFTLEVHEMDDGAQWFIFGGGKKRASGESRDAPSAQRAAQKHYNTAHV